MTEDDADRIETGAGAWDDALARQRQQRHRAADADLFDPDRALGAAMPPAGERRCHHAPSSSAHNSRSPYFTAYPAGRCRITVQAPRHFVTSRRRAVTN